MRYFNNERLNYCRELIGGYAISSGRNQKEDFYDSTENVHHRHFFPLPIKHDYPSRVPGIWMIIQKDQDCT
jgi:hypothetical protein